MGTFAILAWRSQGLFSEAICLKHIYQHKPIRYQLLHQNKIGIGKTQKEFFKKRAVKSSLF